MDVSPHLLTGAGKPCICNAVRNRLPPLPLATFYSCRREQRLIGHPFRKVSSISIQKLPTQPNHEIANSRTTTPPSGFQIPALRTIIMSDGKNVLKACPSPITRLTYLPFVHLSIHPAPSPADLGV